MEFREREMRQGMGIFAHTAEKRITTMPLDESSGAGGGFGMGLNSTVVQGRGSSRIRDCTLEREGGKRV